MGGWICSTLRGQQPGELYASRIRFLMLFFIIFLTASCVRFFSVFGPSWASDVPSWGQLGPILAPRWSYVGVNLGQCCLNFRSYGLLLASWPRKPKCSKSAVLSSILGVSRCPSWGYVGPCWPYVGLSWVIWGVYVAIPSIMLAKMAFLSSTCRSHAPTWLQHGPT